MKALLGIITLLISVNLLAYEAKVLRVIDGDGVEVASPDGKKVLRLFGIDAPEPSQKGGPEASSLLSHLVLGKIVHVQDHTKDKYGRTVADVSIDDKNISETMIREGVVYVYREYCKKTKCIYLVELETKARKARVGVWADSSRILPSDLRHNNLTQKQAESVSFWFNFKSHKLHKQGCPAITRCTKNCKQVSKDLLKKIKYEPCKICHPDVVLKIAEK